MVAPAIARGSLGRSPARREHHRAVSPVERVDRRGAAVGAALAAVTLALMGMNQATVASILGYASVALAVASPPAGLAAAIILIPLNGPAILLPIGLGASLVLAALIGLLLRMPFTAIRARIGVGGLALAAYLAVSLAWLPPSLAGYPPSQFGTATAQFLNLATGAGMLVLGASIFSRTAAAPYLWLAVAAGTAAAFLAVLSAAWGTPAGVPLQALMAATGGETIVRASGAFTNPNYFATHVQLVALVAIALAPRARRYQRLILVPALGILGLGLLVALSRGAITAFLAGLLVLAFARSRRTGLLVAGISLGLAAVAYPLFLETRLEITHPAPGAIQAQDASDAMRRNAMLAGISMFQESPLVGVGFGRFQHVSPWYLGDAPVTFPHNQYIKVLAEQGLVGMVLFLLVLASVLHAVRRGGSTFRPLALAVIASMLIAFLVGEPLISVQTAGVAWLVVAATLATGARPVPPGQSPRYAPAARPARAR